MKRYFFALAAFISVVCSAEAQTTTSTTPNRHPSDKEATEATVELYNNLFKWDDKGVMLGHQDDLAYGIGWLDSGDYKSDVQMVTGDYPALFGWDLGHLELGEDCNLDGVPFEDMRRNIIWVDRNGGVNTFSWHLRNPLTLGDSWDISSKKVVWSILNDASTRRCYYEFLEKLAEFMLSLKRENGELIPVIFRPLHELSGSWFWWGRDLCTVDEYVALWRDTIDFLRAKGVHNMLVSYSMAGYKSVEQFTERYPGDDYVDIVGFDIYHYGTAKEYIEDMHIRSDIARAFALERGMIWAVCETGYETIPDKDWFTTVLLPGIEGKQCSHLLLWRNAQNRPNHFYASYPGHKSARDMKRFAKRDDVLTMSELR